MLEISNYQIFYMILHGCLILFAFAFLFRGSTKPKGSTVVSYREFQRQKHHRKRRQRPPRSTTPPAQSVREVREVTEVYQQVAGADFKPQKQLAGAPQEPTLTQVTVDTAVNFETD